jgi:protein-L-isoaspartate(D-aspartate) O-methyltransferase
MAARGLRSPVALLLLAALVGMVSCAPPSEQKDAKPMDWTLQRQWMVREQLQAPGRDITDRRVLKAMAEVPRHEFVPEDLRTQAYEDHPLAIGHEQTISQPYIVAFMTEQLAPAAHHSVLEIGTGSGYQAAVLAQLVAKVYTIEIVEPLGLRSTADLQRLGYTNVFTKIGDGHRGWPEHAPFDSIIVTCAPEQVPEPLVQQLKEGGRMVIPVGGLGVQELYVSEKRDGRLHLLRTLPVRFVPMTGRAGESNR